VPHQIQLAPSLAIPASGTYLHPWSVRIVNRRDEPTAPAGALIYVRLVDNDGAAITAKLGNTSGTVLAASTSDAFPSASGWYTAAQTIAGLHEGCVLVASGVTAGPIELQIAYSVDGVQANARASSAFAGASSVDLSPVTAAIGAFGDIEDDETVFGAIAGVAEDVAGISLASVEALIGTPASTLAADIAAIKAVVGDLDTVTLSQVASGQLLAYGLVTTATGTGTVTVEDFIGLDLALECLHIEDVSSSRPGKVPPKLRCSRTIASFNSGTGACTVAALAFSPAVGDRVWVYGRAQTGP